MPLLSRRAPICRLVPIVLLLLAFSAGPSVGGTAQELSPAEIAIKILSSSSYTDSIGYLHIVGEVKNTSTVKRRFVRVSARLYNANDRVLRSTFSYTLMDILRPGLVTPFHVIEE